MAKKKVYAVKKGKKTGLFYSWNECDAAVSGYSGAEFKGFFSEEEARAYLGAGWEKCDVDTEKAADDIINAANATEAADQLVAYVDGSFDETIGKYSFGCILLTPGGEIIRESGNGDNPESMAIRNVAGEMLGAMFAVRWAVVNGYRSIEVRYDYAGIEKWACGAWKTNHPLTRKYAEFMNRQQSVIRITFRKVKAHTGDHYNEEADKLAKSALTEGNGIPSIK